MCVRETHWNKGQSGEILIQKLDRLFVSFEEEERTGLTDIVTRVGTNVDERVTKRFYEEFRKQHAAFLKFVTGIPNQGDHEWYASVMLNRLMFLYFVQRKGFLDGDTHEHAEICQGVAAWKGFLLLTTHRRFWPFGMTPYSGVCQRRMRPQLVNTVENPRHFPLYRGHPAIDSGCFPLIRRSVRGRLEPTRITSAQMALPYRPTLVVPGSEFVSLLSNEAYVH